jgi:hypothetical protein
LSIVAKQKVLLFTVEVGGLTFGHKVRSFFPTPYLCIQSTCVLALARIHAQTQISCLGVDKYDITSVFMVLIYVAH